MKNRLLNDKTIRHWAAIGMRQQLRAYTDAAGELKTAIAALERKARPAEAKPKARARRPMTAAQRKAVAIRMKKYWAERRKAASK